MIKIQEVNPNTLKIYLKNAKRHDDKQVKKIADSIKEFGFNTPLLVDKNMNVIAGHGRLLAAELLGLKSVPIIIKDDLTPVQIKAYRLADNKVAESDWIQDLLKEELLELKNMDYDLNLTGFDLREVNSYLKGVGEVIEVEADDPNKITTEIKKGDIIQLGNNYVMCGDSTNSENIDYLIKLGGGAD